MHAQPAIPLPVQAAPSAFAFGPFVLIPDRRLLLSEGSPLKVGGRALQLLTALVQRPGAVVSKSYLMTRVWPDVVTPEGNLKANIATLRRALGDDPDRPRYIATVVGRGYRFISPVRRSDLAPSEPALPESSVGSPALRLFGRATVIAAIHRDLERARLVSVVGPGGVGKTTVAMAVAREAASGFVGGARFVDLTVVADGSRVPSAVADALGVKGGLAMLAGYLRERRLLVVLDNCEHVIDAVANWAHQVLTNATNVRLLATSREPLCVGGERVRRLGGLDTPPPGELPARAALEFAAVQLFVERASRASRVFALNDANAAVVAELCRRVDGLALAIEGLASRVGTVEVSELLGYVASRPHLLDACRPDVERHRSLSAAIEWSYRLLTERERGVLRRLSILADTFDLEAACAIAATEGEPPFSVVEDVASLAAKSLLTVELLDGRTHYRLPHVARAFAQEKLRESGELTTKRSGKDRR